MTEQAQRDILQAIMQDDPKAFDAATGKHKNLCFGRFSLLAVCYLYDSDKIIAAYGSAMRQGNPAMLDEPRQIYNDFVPVAGKALRLWAGYVQSPVHPLEMLALKGDRRALRQEFPTYVLEQNEQARLLTAIKLRYGVKASIRDGQLVLPARTLDGRQKRALLSIGCALLILLLAATSLLAVGTVFKDGTPMRSAEDMQRIVSGKQYVLRSDIRLTENMDISDIRLNGNGHTIEIEVSDAPALASFGGVIENCTVLFKGKDIRVNQAYACLCAVNEGVWRNVHFLFEGDWTVSLEGFEQRAGSQQTCAFGALFVHNRGTLDHCTLSGNLRWIGQVAVDGELGAFAGTNQGVVNGCALDGSIWADTLDMGGLVFSNEATGIISDCSIQEDATVTQTTAEQGWSPKVGGICAVNYGTIENAAMHGVVTCAKENVPAYQGEQMISVIQAGGICAVNFNTILHSLVTGNVNAYGDESITDNSSDIKAEVQIGGICGICEPVTGSDPLDVVLSQNIVTGSVYANSDYAVIGGIAGIAAARFEDNCFNGMLNFGKNIKDGAAGSFLGYGVFPYAELSSYFKNNHVNRIYRDLGVIGYCEELSGGLAAFDGVAEHGALEFNTLEAYWYGE